MGETMRARRAFHLALAGVAMAGLLVGCGSDDDDEAADGESAAFCDGFLELNSGEPTPAKVRQVAADAPDAGKKPLETIADGMEEQGEDYTDSEEFGTNYEAVNKVVADECADDSIEVTAAEYKFTGIPSEIDKGIVGATFKNAGGELHEIIVLRKKDGVTESFEDILAKGEDEAEKFVDVSFGAFGDPGSEHTAVFNMKKAGTYAAICFVSVGSTPDNPEADGPPHFTQGMITEFSVN